MRVVLLISIDGLSSHRFTFSSFKGLSAPSLISTLLGDVMAATWVQKDVNWDGFPSSTLVPLSSLEGMPYNPTFPFLDFPKIL
jgi:hypothetical protein